MTTEMNETDFDFSFVHTPARIAVYDDLHSAPRIITINPAPTAEYIENIATTAYNLSQQIGGSIPYTVIREVSENFIHAHFIEAVISILDKGNTIRFADQGPGIANKENAQRPGFTSATEPMKSYIRGVGSGLPIVKDYLNFSHGVITIEDNLNTGAVVTITLKPNQSQTVPSSSTHINKVLLPQLSQKEHDTLVLFATEGELGVTEVSNLTGQALSSVHSVLSKLEHYGVIEKTDSKKRVITEFGMKVLSTI